MMNAVHAVPTLSGRRISALKGTATLWGSPWLFSGATVTVTVPVTAPLACS